MPSKKTKPNASNLAKSRVKKISVTLPSAENKIHRNKDIAGYKSWKAKSDEILAKKQQRKKNNARKGIVRGPKPPDHWKQSNKKTSKRHKSLLERSNLRRLATNVNITRRPSNNVSKSPLRLKRFMSVKNTIKKKQQKHINNTLSKKSKIFVPKPSKLGKKSNKAKNLVKMHKNRESQLNKDRLNYDFMNNAPSKEVAAAAANNQPSILGNIMSGVSRLFQGDSERKSHV